MLAVVQRRLKERILEPLELLPEVRGYRRSSHNINACADICGQLFMGKVDISKFHPSISHRHLACALKGARSGASWSREIARLATYSGGVPQGASTSNHAANVVMDSLLRRFIKRFAERRRVGFRNFGDDIAFFGHDALAVQQCVERGKRVISRLGFKANEKCRDCEHRGGKREFIGCATGRDLPDLPRAKFRAIKKEMRSMLRVELSRSSIEPITSRSEMNSLRHRILYVKRLNRRKARSLQEIYFRIAEGEGKGLQRRESPDDVAEPPRIQQ